MMIPFHSQFLPILFTIISATSYNDFLTQSWHQLRQIMNHIENISNINDCLFKNGQQNIFDDNFYKNVNYFTTLNSSSLFHESEAQCLIDLLFLEQSLINGHMWAIEAIDSWARLPSGVIRGNTLWPGSFDQCLSISASGQAKIRPPFGPSFLENATFDGLYCMASLINKSMVISDATVNGDLRKGFQLGICAPKSCGAKSVAVFSDIIASILNSTLQKLDLDFGGVRCYNEDYKKFDSLAIISFSILCLLLFFTILATILNWNQTKEINNHVVVTDQIESFESSGEINSTSGNGVPLLSASLYDFSPFKKLIRMSKCFSLHHNAGKIFKISQQNVDNDGKEMENQDEFNILHGLRFLSMAWIILGHTYYFSFAILQNPLDLIDPDAHGILYQTVLQGPFAVDTFFILSGILVTFGFFRLADRYVLTIDRPKFWMTFYFYRIWRLTPAYALILLLYTGLFKFLGDGPFWPTDGLDTQNCRTVWWTNLLYINNIVDVRDPENPEQLILCMGWTWFLSADTQMFILSPFLLYILHRSRFNYIFKITSFLVFLMTIFFGLLVTSLIVSIRDLPPNFIPATFDLVEKARILELDVYFKPYPHIVCYVSGILIGYFCYHKDQYDGHFRLPKILKLLLWSISLAFMLLVVYGLFPQYRGTIYSRHVAALYVSGSRVAWSVAIGWIILACRFGHSGPVGKFLGWAPFIPLSRLTYCAYLIHPMVMFWYYFTLRTPIYYTDISMIWIFVGFLVFTYGAAFFVSILVEAPFLAMKQLFRN